MADEVRSSDEDVATAGRGVIRETLSIAVAIMVAAAVFAFVPVPLRGALHDAIVIVGLVPAAACCVLLLVFQQQIGNGVTARGRQVRWWCNLLLTADLALGGALLVLALVLR